MTVEAAALKSGPYAGTGAQVLFTVTFDVADITKLAVYVKDLNGLVTKKTDGVDYNVEFVVSFFVRFTTAPLATDTILILNEEAYLQDTDFTIGDSVDLTALQTTVDRLARQVKQLLEIQDRCLRFEKFSTKSALEVAAPVAGDDGRAIVYDAASDSYSHVTLTSAGTLAVSPYAETLLNDADASAAQSTLGLVPDTNVTATPTFDAHAADLDAHSTLKTLAPPVQIVDLVTGSDTAFTTVVVNTLLGDVARFAVLRVRLFLAHLTNDAGGPGNPGGRAMVVRIRRLGDISSGDSIINVELKVPIGAYEPVVTQVERTVIVQLSAGQSFQYQIQQTNGVGTNEIQIVQEGYFT